MEECLTGSQKVVGSTPIVSTKQVLDEHLLFQRRICRKMCSLIQQQNAVSV